MEVLDGAKPWGAGDQGHKCGAGFGLPRWDDRVDAHLRGALPEGQREALSHCRGRRHELSMRRSRQGGRISMRTRVPIPHSGQSRRFLPVRAA